MSENNNIKQAFFTKTKVEMVVSVRSTGDEDLTTEDAITEGNKVCQSAEKLLGNAQWVFTGVRRRAYNCFDVYFELDFS